MTKPSMNLQDGFLNQVRKEGAEVKVVMLDGSRLAGYVRGFDNFTVILHSHGLQHLLYKHAIAQLIAKKPQRKDGPGPHDPDEPEVTEPKTERPPKEKAPFNRIDFSGVKDADERSPEK